MADKEIHLKENNVYKDQDNVPIKAIDLKDETHALAVFLQSGSSELPFLVNSGKLEGYRHERKYGINVDVNSSTSPEYIWDGQGQYNYPTENETINLISSSENDTEVTVYVQGLIEEDGDWNEQTLEVTLNGTTAVEVGSFIRVYRLRVTSSVNPEGVVYATTGTVQPAPLADLRGQISLDLEESQSRNSSLMAMYTVPSGYTAFLNRLFGSVRKGQDAEVDYQIRKFGGAFYTTGIVSLYQNSQQFELDFERVEEKSDIRVAVTSENNNVEVRASFHMILVNNDYL